MTGSNDHNKQHNTEADNTIFLIAFNLPKLKLVKWRSVKCVRLPALHYHVNLSHMVLELILRQYLKQEWLLNFFQAPDRKTTQLNQKQVNESLLFLILFLTVYLLFKRHFVAW